MRRIFGLRSASPQPSIQSTHEGSPASGTSNVNIVSSMASALGPVAGGVEPGDVLSAAWRSASARSISLDSKW